MQPAHRPSGSVYQRPATYLAAVAPHPAPPPGKLPGCHTNFARAAACGLFHACAPPSPTLGIEEEEEEEPPPPPPPSQSHCPLPPRHCHRRSWSQAAATPGQRPRHRPRPRCRRHHRDHVQAVHLATLSKDQSRQGELGHTR